MTQIVWSPQAIRDVESIKSDIVQQMQAWVHRGELPEKDIPRPDWIIDRLVEEELIEPFRRSEYINEPDEDFQEFHQGRRLLSVGKAGYLFEISDPERPRADYPIGRFPGSTPRASLLL